MLFFFWQTQSIFCSGRRLRCADSGVTDASGFLLFFVLIQKRYYWRNRLFKLVHMFPVSKERTIESSAYTPNICPGFVPGLHWSPRFFSPFYFLFKPTRASKLFEPSVGEIALRVVISVSGFCPFKVCKVRHVSVICFNSCHASRSPPTGMYYLLVIR